MSKAQDNVKKYVDKITKDDAVLKEIRRLKMTNIDEMEKILKEYKIRDRYVFVRDFMEHCINSLKDLHEENRKLWKEIAKLRGER